MRAGRGELERPDPRRLARQLHMHLPGGGRDVGQTGNLARQDLVAHEMFLLN